MNNIVNKLHVFYDYVLIEIDDHLKIVNKNDYLILEKKLKKIENFFIWTIPTFIIAAVIFYFVCFDYVFDDKSIFFDMFYFFMISFITGIFVWIYDSIDKKIIESYKNESVKKKNIKLENFIIKINKIMSYENNVELNIQNFCDFQLWKEEINSYSFELSNWELKLISTNPEFNDRLGKQIQLKEEHNKIVAKSEECLKSKINKIYNSINNIYQSKKQIEDRINNDKRNSKLIEIAKKENRICSDARTLLYLLKQDEKLREVINKFIEINITVKSDNGILNYYDNINETFLHRFSISDVMKYFVSCFVNKEYLFEFGPDPRLDYIERYIKYYKYEVNGELEKLFKDFVKIVIDSELIEMYKKYDNNVVQIALYSLIMNTYIDKIALPFEKNINHEMKKEYYSVIKEYVKQKLSGSITSMDGAFAYLIKNDIYIPRYDLFFYYTKFQEDVQNFEKERREKHEKEKYMKLLFGKEEESTRIINIDDIDQMDGSEFEMFLCKIFNKMGYNAIQTKGSGDQGIDVIAQNNISKIGIQAKRYTGTVGNSAVQEAIAGKVYYNCDRVMVITNSTFTPMAIQLAKKAQVELWDREFLKRQISICQIEK